MWNNESVNFDDVLVEMEKNLRKSAYEEKTSRLRSRVEALQLLNKAADNFEKIGLIKEADAITRIVELAQNEKPVSKKAEAEEIVEEETSPEEDKLYDALLEDPNVLEEITVDADGNEEEIVPSAELLAKMW